MVSRAFSAFLTALGVAGWLALAFAGRAEEPATAQGLLFDAPYLARLSPPATLVYGYRHAAKDEKVFGAAFEDTVRISVAPSATPGGLNSVSLEIFSGARQRRLGPHTDMTGNPALMVFLEHDLWEMKRRVGGVPIYYRNMIRKAFRDAARIEAVEIMRDGKATAAHKVTITPFLGDPNGARLKEFRGKTYEFVVAASIPGGIHQIRAWVPGPGSQDVLIEDRMTFSRIVESVER